MRFWKPLAAVLICFLALSASVAAYGDKRASVGKVAQGWEPEEYQMGISGQIQQKEWREGVPQGTWGFVTETTETVEEEHWEQYEQGCTYCQQQSAVGASATAIASAYASAGSEGYYFDGSGFIDAGTYTYSGFTPQVGCYAWQDIPQWMVTQCQVVSIRNMSVTQSILGDKIPGIYVYANRAEFTTIGPDGSPVTGVPVRISESLATATARTALIIYGLAVLNDENYALIADAIPLVRGTQTFPARFCGSSGIDITMSAGPMYDWEGVSKNTIYVEINKDDPLLYAEMYITYLDNGDTPETEWIPGFVKFLNL